MYFRARRLWATGQILISATLFASASGCSNATVEVTDLEGMTSFLNTWEEGAIPSALTLNITERTIAQNNSLSFVASGGKPPYVFSVVPGTGNGHISLGGFFTPTVAGSLTVKVTDLASSTTQATVHVMPSLMLTPTTQTVSAKGAFHFSVLGGVPPLTYFAEPGGGSFAGGAYSAPDISSGATVQLKVRDSFGNEALAIVTIPAITVSINTPPAYINAANKSSFPVSGSCSENGQNVLITATGGVIETAVCAGNLWNTILDLTNTADGLVMITANHSNIHGVAAPLASRTVTKDASAPTVAIGTPSAGAYVNAANQASFAVSGTCSDNDPGNVVIKADSNSVATVNCSGNAFSATINLSGWVQGAHTLAAQHHDAAGNATTSSPVSVTKDTQLPNPPTGQTDGTWMSSTTQSPVIAWAAASDQGASGLNRYEVALGTSAGGIDVVAWTSAGTSTSKQFAALVLSDGATYYASIRSVDNAGNVSPVAQADGWTVDATAPSEPTGLDDGEWKNSTSQSPTISWDAVTDSGSGLDHYEIAVGTTLGGTNVLNWASTGLSHNEPLLALSLSDGITYYASIRAVDVAGNVSSIAQGNGWTVDITPPSPPTVVDDGDFHISLDGTPSISWSGATDNLSGVAYYNVAIGTTPGGTDIYDWTYAGSSSISLGGLTLNDGATYYASVISVDSAGNNSGARSSNGWEARGSCPVNFVRVPGLAGYAANAFCVSQYEMKISSELNGNQTYDSSWIAASKPEGTPWVNVDRTQARNECQALGAGYDLISNGQWQAIARNLENVGANWISGVTGTGGMFRGHSDSVPNNTLQVSEIANPYTDTDGNDATTGPEQKRTQRLSTGEILWDFAGNVEEWVLDNFSVFDFSSYDGSISAMTSAAALTGRDLFGPVGDYSSLVAPESGGLGRATLYSPLTGAIRGGSYYRDFDSGVFTVDVNLNDTLSNNAIGFRCVKSIP